MVLFAIFAVHNYCEQLGDLRDFLLASLVAQESPALELHFSIPFSPPFGNGLQTPVLLNKDLMVTRYFGEMQCQHLIMFITSIQRATLFKTVTDGSQIDLGGRAIYYFQGREQAKNQTQTKPT